MLTVEGWHRRGYVQRMHLALQAAYPHLSFDFDNRGEGGATSRDIARIVAKAVADEGSRYDQVFLGCGINDVWRSFQGHAAEAVGPQEFAGHATGMLAALGLAARTVVCVTETPFGPMEKPDTVAAINAELARYNALAASAARAAGAAVLNVWEPFLAAARHLPAAASGDALPGLWSDGVHLSELGDALMLPQVETLLAAHRTIDGLVDDPQLERSQATDAYGPLFATKGAGPATVTVGP